MRLSESDRIFIGPDGRRGVWRWGRGGTVFVPVEGPNVGEALPVPPNVVGWALTGAEAGELVWVTLVDNSDARVMLFARDAVNAGDLVAMVSPTAVVPVRQEEKMVTSASVYITSSGLLRLPEETEVAGAEDDDIAELVKYTSPSFSGPRRSQPRGWRALVARVGKEGAALLDQGEPFTVQSRRWPGVLFGVKKDGSVSAVVVVREDDKPADLRDVEGVPAPTYPGNGGPPPWPEIVLGRLVALEADETLLFGTGELGGVAPVTRRMRVGVE